MQLVMVVIRKRDLRVLTLASLLFVASYILVVEPVYEALNQSHLFVSQVESSRLSAHAKLAFFHESTDGLVIKYLANAPLDVQPIFLKEAGDLEKLNTPAYIIATEENSHRIFLPVLFRGKIGREPVIVFSKNVSHPQGAS